MLLIFIGQTCALFVKKKKDELVSHIFYSCSELQDVWDYVDNCLFTLSGISVNLSIGLCLCLDVATVIQKCSFCGSKKHSRRFCPARDVECYRCGKKGHFAKVCRSFATRQSSSSSAALMPIYCGNENNSKVNVPIMINGVSANALIDTGSTLSHMSKDFCKRLHVTFKGTSQRVGLAVTNCVSSCLGTCKVEIQLDGQNYTQVPVAILKNLLTDVILGQDFMELHNEVTFHFGGTKPILHVGALKPIKTSTPVKLFEHLHNNCQPIATKERRYSEHNKKFISSEVRRHDKCLSSS